MGDYAAKLEIKLVVEALTPYESNFFTRANDLVELFRRVDNPYVVGMCDIVPPFVQHESIMAYFDKLGNKMDHMHIIDGENGSDTHLIPGEGNIPIKEMLYEMKRIGYDKTATLELVTNYINEPRFYAKRAIDNMRELMARGRNRVRNVKKIIKSNRLFQEFCDSGVRCCLQYEKHRRQ